MFSEWIYFAKIYENCQKYVLEDIESSWNELYFQLNHRMFTVFYFDFQLYCIHFKEK